MPGGFAGGCVFPGSLPFGLTIPVVGGLFRAVQFLVLGIAPGSREANRFGPPCDARASDAEPSGEDPVALWCLFWLLEAARAAFVVYTLLPLLNPNGD